MVDAFPISGSIDPKAFPFLLMDLHRQGATGSLKVEGPTYQKALYFRTGKILFGSSNDPRDQLGAILIENGKITPAQLDDVNAKVGPGNPLAKALAQSGVLNQRELSEAARAKVERILSDIIAYTAGSFEFEDGVLPKGAVDLKLSTERLFLAALRRVSDRDFVTRHLGSLDVVLKPAPGMSTKLTEIAAEVGNLPDQFDGHRSLKEAVSRTRFEEFEAAKMACALLFLGCIELALPAAEEDTPFFVPAEPDDLDLSQTARMALAEEEELPDTVVMPALIDPLPDIDTSPAPRAASLKPESSGFALVEPQSFALPPTYEPLTEPSAPTSVLPSGPERSFVVAPADYVEPEPETGPAPAPPPRPSHEDMAALDALLNSRALEGPLAPLEKAPERQDRWEPRFGQTQPVVGGRKQPPARRSLLPLVLAAVVLGGGTLAGIGWYFLGRASKPPGPGEVAASVAPPTPIPATAEPSTTPVPSTETAAPTPTPTAAAPSSTPGPTPTPTPAPSPTPVATPASRGAVVLAETRSLFQKGRYDDAARGFAANMKRVAATSFSIQILVACSEETIQKAVENVTAEELYILPIHYRGRDCYRLCWGVYENQARANSALHSMPDYFRKGGASPRVVAASSLLP